MLVLVPFQFSQERKLTGEVSDRFQVAACKLQNAVRFHQRHSGENVVCDVAGAINDHIGYDLTESADEFLRLLLGAGRIGVLVFFLAKTQHRQVRQALEGGQIVLDEIYGDITVPNEELDDLILIKSDGYPTYNFANVVDDHLMGITHVVRGNEYLSSAPKYNKIYEAFGWDVPVYVHCPLITDENHKKLSKRCGHSSYEDLIEQGFVTEAVVNYVALLGWSPEGNQEIFSLEELVKAFDFHRMNKSPAVFDLGKLKWMNGEYIKAMDFDKFYERAEKYVRDVITKDYDLKKIAALVKSRIEIFPDIEEQIDFFEAVPEYDTAMYCHKKMKTNEENSLEVLKEVLPLLEAQEDYSNDALFALLKKYVDEKGVKVGYVMWPIRTAVSGKQSTPGGATEIMEILGKEESVKRIKDGIELLSK